MSIHWRDLDTPAKIEAVRAVFVPGMSAKQIAAHFNGATRNAVIGLFHRHSEKITGDGSLRDGTPPKKVALRRPNIKKAKTRKPLPQSDTLATESHLCGRPLSGLKTKECRWPINDAEAGALHLFCGAPTDKSYCEHHTFRAHRRTDLERLLEMEQ